jgi:hypothetical protein
MPSVYSPLPGWSKPLSNPNDNTTYRDSWLEAAILFTDQKIKGLKLDDCGEENFDEYEEDYDEDCERDYDKCERDCEDKGCGKKKCHKKRC